MHDLMLSSNKKPPLRKPKIFTVENQSHYDVEADAKTPWSNKPKIFQSKWLN